MLFIAIAATSCHWWEIALTVCLSAAVEDSDDEAVVFFAHSTESILQVVERDLFACIGYNDLALVVTHHPVAAVVHHSQSLLVGPRVFGNLVLQRKEELLGLGKVKVFSHNYFCVFVEAILLDVLAEHFDVLYDFGQISEA